MRKHRQQHGAVGKADRTGKEGRASIETAIKKMAVEVITPGRAPAEGPDIDIESPSHERWEQATAERAPAEGPAD